MNKKIVIKTIAKNTNLPKSNVELVIENLEELILDALRKGETINFTGFIKLYTKQKNERAFVNFQTGESFIAPAKVVPAVKFSPKFIKKL
ncbi:MAG: HU family DNA-binding protein [Clostridia bacterium]|nr:HU family DNA-binding protein [Clostridia bacterium]MDD4686161.1 HU family DNA-binding protein [Clostridia bacterium]